MSYYKLPDKNKIADINARIFVIDHHINNLIKDKPGNWFELYSMLKNEKASLVLKKEAIVNFGKNLKSKSII